MSLRRKSIVATIAALAATASFGMSTAAAGEPIAGCPTAAGFFMQDASAYPATMAVDNAGNGDGWCG